MGGSCPSGPMETRTDPDEGTRLPRTWRPPHPSREDGGECRHPARPSPQKHLKTCPILCDRRQRRKRVFEEGRYRGPTMYMFRGGNPTSRHTLGVEDSEAPLDPLCVPCPRIPRKARVCGAGLHRREIQPQQRTPHQISWRMTRRARSD